jgi:hypothetical protein
MLVGQLGFTQKEPTLILEDNEGCIFAIENDKDSAKLKHIDIKNHFCKSVMPAMTSSSTVVIQQT